MDTQESQHRPAFYRASARDRRGDRRGSILIFVVGILLLLAIVATAFLGTSRSDRTSTQQNANNTQVDLLLEGVLNTMKGVVLADARYNTGANGYDSPVDDKFLASRIPVPADLNTPAITAPGPASANPAIWPWVTGPQLDTVFSYPMNSASLPGNPQTTYANRSVLEPTSINFNGSMIPAFIVDQNNDPSDGFNASVAVPAMDADGDGIADSGMVKLPVGQLAGLTYYYGARIVDMNSAINFNTAIEWNPNTVGVPGNFFPSNVDLAKILSGNASQQTAQGAALLNYTTQGNTLSSPAYDDNGALRPDFQFSTQYEAYWMQLGRRLGNPGYVNAGAQFRSFDVNNSVALASWFVLKSASTASNIENLLSPSLTAAAPSIAYTADKAVNWFNDNFNFVSPVAPPLTTPLRSILTGSNAVGSDAPVNTSIAASTASAAWAVGKAYSFGDIVSLALPLGSPTSIARNFVCINPHTSTAVDSPDQLNGVLDWSLIGGVNKLQKIDVNTADFGELWWGFRRLMAANSSTESFLTTPPYKADVTTTPVIPGRMFKNVVRDPAAFPSSGPLASTGRSLTSSEMLQVRTALAAVNAMDLRDADDNVTAREITTYDGTVTPPSTHKVTVFGTERQPYIVEVYVNNDNVTTSGSIGTTKNPMGYVGIVLYNPYPDPLTLAGWTIGRIQRDSNAATSVYPLTIVPMGTGQTRFDATVVVPSHGYLVLENYNPSAVPPSITPVPADAGHRPTGFALPTGAVASTAVTPTPPADGSVNFQYVQGLETVVGAAGGTTGWEAVLLRPRICDLKAGTFQENVPTPDDGDSDEGAPAVANLANMVPVESYDFTGMTQGGAGSPPFTVWDYNRASPINASTTPWKWTIGMAPNPTGVKPPQPQGAPVTTPFAAVDDPTTPKATISYYTIPSPPPATPPAPPNPAPPAPTVLVPQVGVQINNSDWPSPHRGTTVTNNLAPFGGFARESDLLQIPYIGAYRILSTTDNPAVGTGQFTEMNTLATDASFVEDEDATDDAYEQLGRFCPLSTLSPTTYVDPTSHKAWPNYTVSSLPPAPPVPPVDYYDFGQVTTAYPPIADATKPSRNIFDIFTTESPLMAALPAVSADEYANVISLSANYAATPMPIQMLNTTSAPGCSYTFAGAVSGGTTITCAKNLPTNNSTIYQNALVQILTGASRGRIAAVTSESVVSNAVTLTLSTSVGALNVGDAFRILSTPPESVGTEGLININTAPWYVLARLPMVVNGAGIVDSTAEADNEALAKAIVQYRDGNPSGGTPSARMAFGPFKSIMDLNRVLDPTQTNALFQTSGGPTATNKIDPTMDYPNVAGDISPLGGTDNVAGDFENRYLVLGRISNMITTRSDKYVIYVILQGWRNAGQSNASLVVQRRAALIVDRNAASPTNATLTTTRVPQQ